MSFQGKTILITGGSRGIGQAIALRFAAACANVVVVTQDSLEAVESAEQQVLKAGGKPLTLNLDLSCEFSIQQSVSQAVDQFGGIDVFINNTSATCLTDILGTTPEQFDVVMATSVRAAFFLSQACYPLLKKSANPHIINISPPLTMDAYWFKDHLAFSLGKYAMSLCTLGMAEQFKADGIAVNSLWPKTTIATQTIKDHFLPEVHASSRWPSIMADAAFELASFKSQLCTANFFTDEELLRKKGMTDFSHYAVNSNSSLMQAFFLPVEENQSRVPHDLFLLNQSK